MKKYNQSLLDYLVDHLEQSNHLHQPNKSTRISGKAAEMLFQVWKNLNNKVSGRIFKRPPVISLEEISEMKKEGLIRDLGDKIEVTDKGSKVIKVMILGNDHSALRKDAPEISYAEAEASTKARSIKLSQKKHEDNWWFQVLQCLR